MWGTGIFQRRTGTIKFHSIQFHTRFSLPDPCTLLGLSGLTTATPYWYPCRAIHPSGSSHTMVQRGDLRMGHYCWWLFGRRRFGRRRFKLEYCLCSWRLCDVMSGIDMSSKIELLPILSKWLACHKYWNLGFQLRAATELWHFCGLCRGNLLIGTTYASLPGFDPIPGRPMYRIGFCSEAI